MMNIFFGLYADKIGRHLEKIHFCICNGIPPETVVQTIVQSSKTVAAYLRAYKTVEVFATELKEAAKIPAFCKYAAVISDIARLIDGPKKSWGEGFVRALAKT